MTCYLLFADGKSVVVMDQATQSPLATEIFIFVLLKFAWAAAQAHGTDPADRQQYEQMRSVIPLVLVRADASDDDPAFVAMP
jgi:hypothetical protein